MTFAFIGLLTVAFGVAACVGSRLMTLGVLCVAALLQAASAMAFGSANITPGHLSLGFFVIAMITRREGLDFAVASIQPLRPGFFLLALSVWGLFSSFVMPRLFAGQFQVFPMNSDGVFIIEQPLFPTGANFNQAVYFLGGLFTFAFVSSLARTNDLLHKAAFAVIAAAAVNLVIVVIDTVTFAAGMSRMLDFLRNADYAQLFSHQYLGIKRVTGSFPEASAFAGTSVGLFAFCFRLWRGGFSPKITGLLALLTILALIFSFSSTGYVALLTYLAMAYSRALTGMEGNFRRNRTTATNRALFVSMGPFLALVAAIFVAIRPDVLDPIINAFDSSVTSKLGSASGVERMSWNMGGLNAFVSTFGLGAGLGSVRTSSFAVGILANMGIIGMLLFGAFFLQLFRGGHASRSPLADDRSRLIASAGRSGCLAMLLGAILSASTVDLGILFYVMAGLSCGALFTRKAYRIPVEAEGPDGAGHGAPTGAVMPVRTTGFSGAVMRDMNGGGYR